MVVVARLGDMSTLPEHYNMNSVNMSFPDSETASLDTGHISFMGFVDSETRQHFQLINYVILCGLFSLFGIGSNIANIIVFVKQGFKDSINISLLGLAIADLSCVVTMFWSSICYNPIFAKSDLPFVSLDVMYLTGGWPHACFNRVTSFITAFITLERCLCIIVPLKIKTIITPRRTKCIIISIFILMFILFCPFYFVNRLEWKFHTNLNKTLLTLAYTGTRAEVESVTFFIHSVAFSAISFVAVIASTVLLVVKLNEKSKWRQTSVMQKTSNAENVSQKDKRVVKMVTFISLIFIVCFLPATAIFFVMAYDPEFSFTGKYENLFFVVWSISFVLETVNSSVNIFIYLKMSSKFRDTFWDLFVCNSVKRN